MFNKEKFRELLNERGLTYKDMATSVGCTDTAIFYILQGYKQPSLALAVRIANFFEKKVDDLIVRV